LVSVEDEVCPHSKVGRSRKQIEARGGASAGAARVAGRYREEIEVETRCGDLGVWFTNLPVEW
jgi:hypothetical protein